MAYTTIKKPSDYFNTKLYTGTGSQLAVTGVGFQPDFVWFKNRGTTNSHGLQDVVRGFNTTGIQSSNGTDADPAFDGSTLGYVSAVGSDGFTVEAGGCANASGNNYVSWNWKAGTTSGITTDGNTTITPSNYSFNQASGFSILSYTGNGVEGAKLAHGLGTTPAMVIIKRYSTTGDWVVYHKNLSATKSVFLNYTDAETARAPNGYIYSPDDTNITLSNHGDVNTNGTTTIAYCFAEKKGFSKFGSYVANASDDGPMIYLGFKPAFVLIKRTSNTNVWILLDNKRGSYNVNQSKLFPDNTDAENTDTSNGIDFLSNGFKIRRNNTEINGASGDTFIYMAFAEEPLVGDNPATAR